MEPKRQLLRPHAKDPELDLHSMTEEYVTYGHRLEPLHRRHRAALLGCARRRREGALRGRPGRAARPRPRHLSVRHLVEPDRRRGLRRRRRRPDATSTRSGASRRPTARASGRARSRRELDGRDRRAAARERRRVRHHHGPAAPLRLARPRRAQVRGAAERHDRAGDHQARRADRLRTAAGGGPLPHPRGRNLRRVPLPPVGPAPRDRPNTRSCPAGTRTSAAPATSATCHRPPATTWTTSTSFIGVPIAVVGVGPGRDQVIWVSGEQEAALKAA